MPRAKSNSPRTSSSSSPRDLSKGNGAIFYDVNNRGNKLALGMFNRPPGGPGPDAKNPAGDGFLMKRGYTVVWSGWIGELLPGGRQIAAGATAGQGERQAGPRPGPTGNEQRQRVSNPCRCRAGRGTAPIRRPRKGAKPRRCSRNATWWMARATVVPRDQVEAAVAWPLRKSRQSGPSGRCRKFVSISKGGFEPGVLYELIYEGEGSLVQGVGFASVRDLISFLRHDASPQNPLCRRRQTGDQSCLRLRRFAERPISAHLALSRLQ